MKPPPRVQVGPFAYRIEVRNQEDDGVANHDNLLLCVNRARPLGAQREILLHEILHALLATSGVASEMGEKREEGLVRALSPWLLDLLQRNPRLVSYLTAGE